MADLIIRQEYIDRVMRLIGRELIIVLTGQRRIGKSCLLRQLRDAVGRDASANVIYIDKERHEHDSIRDYTHLNDYIGSRMMADHHNYIMIDEVQEIEGFERSVRSFRSEPNTDIIITGSNARMLSSELSTIIAGRYKEVYIQPLSYSEFLTFHALSDSDHALQLYLQYGGMPALRTMGLGDDGTDYLRDIYNTILLKDVILRNSIRNVAFIENLTTFLADNTGKLISANSISRYMKSQGEAVTPTAIINYIRYLADAFIIRRVKRYDIHGKKILETNEKIYFEDCGLRNAIVGGSREGDIEKVMESVVRQHIERSGYKVNVGQLRNAEIDFVCTAADGRRAYVQVAFLIADEQTRRSEFGNLLRIADNHPKYVVSMTPLLTATTLEGITHVNLRAFLAAPFAIPSSLAG